MNILLRYLARTCFPPLLWHERQKPLCIIYNDNLDATPMREVGFFVVSDLVNMIGQGRTFESLKSRCKECDVADCDAVSYEADRDQVNKKRVVWRPVQM